MTNDQLLDQLRIAKLLDEDAVAKVKREVIVSNRSAEAIIHERRLVDDVKVATLKSGLLKVPYQKIDMQAFDRAALELIPEETAHTYFVAPLAKRDDVLIAGMLNPDDTKAQEALTFIARRNHLNLGVYLLSYGDWQEIVKKYSPFKTDIEAAVQSLGLDPLRSGRKIVSFEDDPTKGGEQAPIIKIVSDTIQEAVEAGASDIHIEPQEKTVRIRFRVDGDLKEIASLPVEVAQAIVSRIKVLCSLKIDETRVPQDGRFQAKVFEREIDFRISTFPTPLGEKVAIRVLDPSTGLKSFDDLGLRGPNLLAVKKGLEKPFGMILITGPTGSGKTTTLYALLQVMNHDNVNIVSLEDPVEYFVAGVNQSQIRPEIGYDFASGLRQILRQDPDVIMVGEIRDNETANLAIQAALTGHIVLSTLHTNNAIGVIPRLMDMKIEPFLLPVSLNLMVSQRLVGSLCSHCKTIVDVSPEATLVIEKALAGLPPELVGEYKAPYKTYRATGCAKCHERGVTGRVGIFEVLQMSPAIELAVNEGPTVQKLAKIAKEQGMVTLRQDGVLKALAGLISLEEVIRTTDEG